MNIYIIILNWRVFKGLFCKNDDKTCIPSQIISSNRNYASDVWRIHTFCASSRCCLFGFNMIFDSGRIKRAVRASFAQKLVDETRFQLWRSNRWKQDSAIEADINCSRLHDVKGSPVDLEIFMITDNSMKRKHWPRYTSELCMKLQ